MKKKKNIRKDLFLAHKQTNKIICKHFHHFSNDWVKPAAAHIFKKIFLITFFPRLN